MTWIVHNTDRDVFDMNVFSKIILRQYLFKVNSHDWITLHKDNTISYTCMMYNSRGKLTQYQSHLTGYHCKLMKHFDADISLVTLPKVQQSKQQLKQLFKDAYYGCQFTFVFFSDCEKELSLENIKPLGDANLEKRG